MKKAGTLCNVFCSVLCAISWSKSMAGTPITAIYDNVYDDALGYPVGDLISCQSSDGNIINCDGNVSTNSTLKFTYRGSQHFCFIETPGEWLVVGNIVRCFSDGTRYFRSMVITSIWANSTYFVLGIDLR